MRPPSPPPPRRTGAVSTNDLCPVCASGYLEPYDHEFHECLNCGSLVKHIGFEKAAAARPKGGLGRGLGQIIDPGASSVGMGLNPDGSTNPDAVVDLDETQTHHPLAGETNSDPDAVYVAPKRLRDKRSAAEADPIDVFMGKHGYQPIHKAGQPRVYRADMPGLNGRQSAVLMEGTNGGWVLGTKAGPWHASEKWEDESKKPYTKGRIDVPTTNPGRKPFKQPLPSQGDTGAAEMSLLARGHHPIEDPRLAWAIEDLAKNGRNSQVYHQPLLNSAFEPRQLPDVPAAPEGDVKTPYSEAEQRRLRGFSSTDQIAFPVMGSNPGLTKFTG